MTMFEARVEYTKYMTKRFEMVQEHGHLLEQVLTVITPSAASVADS